MKTEAETLVELEKLLDALEPEARKRAADFVAAKYMQPTTRYEFKLSPPHTCCSGPCCMPELYAPGGPKGPALSGGVIVNEMTTVFGPGVALPSGPPMRSWS